MAVNIGYSIGFGYPSENYDPYLWFSLIYVLVGSSFVAVALGFFADKIGEGTTWNKLSQRRGVAATFLHLVFHSDSASECLISIMCPPVPCLLPFSTFQDHDNWFTNLVQQQKYETSIKKSKSPITLFKAVAIQYEAQIRAVGTWLVWVAIMIAYSLFGLGWSFIQALYFAVSTLSTGGHWGLPEEGTPDWMWGLTAFFAMVGVPIMAVAMVSSCTVN